jgi:uncharacterized membrane protein
VGLAGAVVGGAIPIALGWYLMLLAGWSLASLARNRERTMVLLAVTWAGAFAAVLIGADVAATIAMGAAALEPGVGIPPRVPWADAASGVAGFAASVVLTVVARRVSTRYQAAGLTAEAQPA